MTHHACVGQAASRLVVAIALAAAATPGAAGRQTPVFDEVSLPCGVRAVHQPSPGFLVAAVNLSNETGAAAVADFNNDGWQDIYFVTSGNGPDKLFINNANGAFTERGAQWGITDAHMGIGVSAGDFNGDGRIDLYITSLGPVAGQPQVGRHRLLLNGGGSFTNVAVQARVNRTTQILPDGFGSAWGDYDLDGDLDLHVTSWISGTGGNRLFRNNGAGTFTDVTVAARVNDNGIRGFGPRFADMNGDRYPELLIAGDFGTSRYFVNNRDGTFSNRTVVSGTGLDDNGMGSTIGDYNNDGLFDWYVTSIYTLSPLPGVPGTGNMLYLNTGDDRYTEESVVGGVNQGGWGWGTVSVDFDHDGREDIIATNGWHESNGSGVQEWLSDATRAYRNLGGARFADAGAATGLASHTALGRAVCALDFDNDGDMDIFIVSNSGDTALFRSQLISGGVTPPNAHWLRVFLDTRNSGLGDSRRVAPNGYGAKVRASTKAGVQHRVISPGSTYIGQSEASAHFGLGAAAVVDELTVDWPNGRQTTLRGVPADQTITVRYCPADWNGSGDENSADVFDFLTDLFAGEADFNGRDGTNSQDFFDFLWSYFQGCA